ncbi:MAG: hypothetical protein EON56_02340 [Alphaproteobacteria bacterium]|nr:MAG: hypothetical protein EON56_02340 [Alphaproteobacteria bacterium]
MRSADRAAIGDAAIAGLGLAQMSSSLVSDHMRAGRLVAVLPGHNWISHRDCCHLASNSPRRSASQESRRDPAERG